MKKEQNLNNNKEQALTIPVVMLPCPFCGCEDIEYETYNFQESMYQDTSEGACTCQNCGAKGGSVSILHKYDKGRDVTPNYEDEAIALWNARHGA